MKIYVLDLDNNHVATIMGDTDKAVEEAFENRFCSNDYSYTYTPAIGHANGVVESDEAELINACC